MLFFIFVLFDISMCLWLYYKSATEIKYSLVKQKFSLLRNSTVRETGSC